MNVTCKWGNLSVLCLQPLSSANNWPKNLTGVTETENLKVPSSPALQNITFIWSPFIFLKSIWTFYLQWKSLDLWIFNHNFQGLSAQDKISLTFSWFGLVIRLYVTFFKLFIRLWLDSKIFVKSQIMLVSCELSNFAQNRILPLKVKL